MKIRNIIENSSALFGYMEFRTSMKTQKMLLNEDSENTSDMKVR